MPPEHEPIVPAGGSPSEPTILDPAFHQSVWKPWAQREVPESVVDDEGNQDTGESHAVSTPGRRRVVGWASLVAGTVVLAVAIVGNLTTPRPYDATPPLVNNMASAPTVAWTAEGSEACPGGFTKDHMILTDSSRVFSVDLRTGEEAWSVTPTPPIADVVCLPGANVVAMKDDPSQLGPPDSTLLEGTNGQVLAVLPSTTAMQVMPLGRNIGVMSPEGILSMVTREEPLVAVWSHTFPKVAQPSTLYTTPIDEDTVQFVRWSTGGRDSEANFATSVLSLGDGSVPEWFTDPGAAQSRYSIIDDVVVSMDWRSRPVSVALDAEGNQVWSRGGVATIDDGGFEYPTVSDGRLFFNAASIANETSRVFEVDADTGIEVVDLTHSGEFDSVLAIPGGGIAAVSSRGTTLLDEHLQPRTLIDGDQVSVIGASREQLFFLTVLDASISAETMRLTAISRDDYSIVWTLDLQRNQYVQQMGRHLVVVDRDRGTLSGLTEAPQ